MPRTPSRTLLFLVSLLLVLAAPGLVRAEAAGPGWVPAWIDESGDLSDEAVQQVVDGVAARQARPDHVILLVHGFNNTRSYSAALYDDLAPRIHGAFAKLGQEVAVVGIQWDSAASGRLLALPGEYEGKVPLARKVGRFGARRVMLALQERFPSSRLSLFGHSMGCEVAAAALVPHLKLDPITDAAGAFRPEEPLAFHVVVLAGSDLDYDVAYKGGVPMAHARGNLLWMTMSRLYRRADRDRVLDLRALLRGKAMGSTLPRMTGAQYRSLMEARKVVFDNERIPSSHSFLHYYDDVRLGRLAATMAHLAAPTSVPRPEDLAVLDRVMEAPNTVEGLRPWLDSRKLSAAVYAAWRLENLLGDGEKHFEDETLTHVADGGVNRPRAVRVHHGESPCALIREGLWPTRGQLARAGSPAWASPTGSAWKKDFRGEVTFVDEEYLEIVTEFGDSIPFVLAPNRTAFTPSLHAVRVGSAVQVQSDFDHTALKVRVLPLSEWLRIREGR